MFCPDTLWPCPTDRYPPVFIFLPSSKCCGVNVDAEQVFKVGVENARDDDDNEVSPATGGYGRGRGGAGGRTIRSNSVGMQSKESLADLMGTISATQPRYCIFDSFWIVCLSCSYFFFCFSDPLVSEGVEFVIGLRRIWSGGYEHAFFGT